MDGIIFYPNIWHFMLADCYFLKYELVQSPSFSFPIVMKYHRCTVVPMLFQPFLLNNSLNSYFWIWSSRIPRKTFFPAFRSEFSERNFKISEISKSCLFYPK